MLISLIIRTLNEDRYLEELLESIFGQRLRAELRYEVVLVDSGSSDSTLEIAERMGCRVTHISQEAFSFGRSLNLGCEFSLGDVLVFVSGHCVPVDQDWLARLIEPLIEGEAAYSYGRQLGRDSTKFSERELFNKYFPDFSRLQNTDIFCNNANAALLRSCWTENHFDEMLLGLEDMELATRLIAKGERIAYVADAAVYHIHDESWRQTKRRYEREAIALQRIMPDVHVTFVDFVHFLIVAIYADCLEALRQRCLLREFVGILKFRAAQYWGSYRGNHDHRQISSRRKYEYFYPTKVIGD